MRIALNTQLLLNERKRNIELTEFRNKYLKKKKRNEKWKWSKTEMNYIPHPND